MTFETIESAANPFLKEVRRAAARGERTAAGLAIAETFHLLEEALRSQVEIAAVLCSPDARPAVEQLLSRRRALPRLIEIKRVLLRGLATTETPQGVLSLVRLPDWPLDRVLRFRSLAVILDGVQDPGNAGTIARAAEAFGASGLIFLKGSVSPYHPKVLRASAGSLMRLPFVSRVTPEELLMELESRHVQRWVALPAGGCPAPNAALDEACAIVIGSEGSGVSEIMRAGAAELTIPTSGVESLNAAVAAAIILYEAYRQRIEV